MAYRLSSAVTDSFAHFFNTKELRDHYTRAFMEVAGRVKNSPNVLGYDIMNEPSCGNGDLLGGQFENDHLKPFYQDTISGIREVHPQAVGFVEPHIMDMYACTFTPFDLDRLVYAPHLYNQLSVACRFQMPFEDMILSELLRNHKEKARELRMPLFIGEFGDTWKKGVDERNGSVNGAYEVLEESFTNSAYWDYSVKDVSIWNEEDFSIIDENGKPRGLEVNVRPYVRLLNGAPESQSFDIIEKNYALKFRDNTGKAPTVIYLPQEIQYPYGFKVEISDGRYEYRKESRELQYFPDSQGDHAVYISAERSSEPQPHA
jgi:endoglycosylceramidase